MIKIRSWRLSLFYYFVCKVLWYDFANRFTCTGPSHIHMDFITRWLYRFSEWIFNLLGIWTSVSVLLGLWTSVFGFLKYIRGLKILWETGFYWLINIAFGLNVLNFHFSITSLWRYLIHADTTGTNSNASARVWMDYPESVSFNEFYS